MTEAKETVKRIELPLSTSYVLHWDWRDALREIFQNAIDIASQGPEQAMSVHYDGNSFLDISNRNTELNVSSLLMGESNKPEGSIGKFGEGYKLALLVLLREGHSVYITTGDQMWIPGIEYSKTFNRNILVVDIYRENEDRSSTTFEIQGITKEQYDEYIGMNLSLDDEYSSLQTNFGNLLLDEKHRGKIFMGGLFVMNTGRLGNFRYGYDFKPGQIPIDRDRQRLDGFDLQWKTSQMLAALDDPELIGDAEDLYDDMNYIENHLSHDSFIAKAIWEKFEEKHKGELPVPTSNQADLMRVEYQHVKPRVVGQKMFDIMKQTTEYKNLRENLEPQVKEKVADRLKRFYDENADYMSPVLQSRFIELIGEAESWE